MADRPAESWRARAAVSEALDFFNSSYMQEVWAKALARRESDPEGAVTSARTLLESVCKHILDAAGKQYSQGRPLPRLYEQTREVLDLGPDDDTAPIFNKLFTACTEIVESIGSLRNHLSDSHGRGHFGTMPDWRHAELAVNLSGAMATYLAAVWKGREPTVADVIKRHIEVRTKGGKALNESFVYALNHVARGPLGEIVASRLKVVDIIEYLEARIRGGTSPSTNIQTFVQLRQALGEQAAEIFEDAFRIATQRKLIAKAVERTRRVSDEELAALAKYYATPKSRGMARRIPMVDILHFAAWSGLMLGDIFKLRWSDVDFEKRTGRLPGRKEPIPFLERAWDIVTARKEAGLTDGDGRIFPFRARSVVSAGVNAKNQLIAEMPALANFRLNDLRYEAVCRLLERKHPPHEVAAASGMPLARVVRILHTLSA